MIQNSTIFSHQLRFLSLGIVDIFLLPIIIEAVMKAMDESLSQNDLDALFGDIMAEVKKPRVTKEVKNTENSEGSEVLSQDQIDELLKSFQND
jgi:hypothetical protein